jgi:hypothetical protein
MVFLDRPIAQRYRGNTVRIVISVVSPWSVKVKIDSNASGFCADSVEQSDPLGQSDLTPGDPAGVVRAVRSVHDEIPDAAPLASTGPEDSIATSPPTLFPAIPDRKVPQPSLSWSGRLNHETVSVIQRLHTTL